MTQTQDDLSLRNEILSVVSFWEAQQPEHCRSFYENHGFARFVDLQVSAGQRVKDKQRFTKRWEDLDPNSLVSLFSRFMMVQGRMR